MSISSVSPQALDSSELAGLHLRRRRDIDGLRGIAVAAVVLYHFFPDIVPGGFVGVDVFFVISGVVITNLLIRQQPFSWRAQAVFWGHRVRRLFPALVLVLAATLVAGWFILLPAQFEGLGEATAWSAAMLGNVYAFTETNYFAAEPTWNPLLNLWSLGVEEQFYLAWPALMALLWWITRSKRLLLILAITLLTLGSWTWAHSVGSASTATNDVASVFYLPWFRAWELLLGALVALALYYFPQLTTQFPRRFTAAIYWVSVAGLLVALIWPYEDPRPTSYATAAVILTAIVIALGPGVLQAETTLGNPPRLALGRVSYPLYLWHWPLLSVGLAAGIAQTLTGKTALIALALALAAGTWLLVEKPIQRKKVSVQLSTTLIAVMTAVAVIGLVSSQLSMNRVYVNDVAAQLAEFEANPPKDFGDEQCFIEGGDGQPVSDLQTCIPTEPQDNGILVWGDSHASSMIAGIKEAAGDRPLTQVSIAGCEPSLPQDSRYENCAEMNSIALDAVERGLFTDVVLAAWWRDEYDPQEIVRLVNHLDETTAANIIVVGPLPRWTPALPRVWSPAEIEQMERLPLYTAQGLMDEPFEFDAKLRAALSETTAKYVSPLDAMCRSEGCRVAIDGTPVTFTAWDYGHLTPDGSGLLASEIAPIL